MARIKEAMIRKSLADESSSVIRVPTGRYKSQQARNYAKEPIPQSFVEGCTVPKVVTSSTADSPKQVISVRSTSATSVDIMPVKHIADAESSRVGTNSAKQVDYPSFFAPSSRTATHTTDAESSRMMPSPAKQVDHVHSFAFGRQATTHVPDAEPTMVRADLIKQMNLSHTSVPGTTVRFDHISYASIVSNAPAFNLSPKTTFANPIVDSTGLAWARSADDYQTRPELFEPHDQRLPPPTNAVYELKNAFADALSEVKNDSVRPRVEIEKFSDTSIITADLMERLGVKPSNDSRDIHTANSVSNHNVTSVPIHVTGMQDTDTFCVKEVVVVDKITDISESIPINNVAAQYPYLKDIEFSRLQTNEVELLLGNDIHEAFRMTDQRHGDYGQPFGLKTMLDWTLFGGDYSADNACDCDNVVHVNFVPENELQDGIEQILNTMTSDFADLDKNFEVRPSVEESMAAKIMESTVAKVGKHYQVGLPWRGESLKLPPSRRMAKRRLYYIKKSFKTDPELFEKYKNKIHDYFENGYACVVRSDKVATDNDKLFYIPHHSTGKNSTLYLIVLLDHAEYHLMTVCCKVLIRLT